MIAKLMDNREFIELSDINPVEADALRRHFVKKINQWYIIKKKFPYANIEESFIMNNSIIPFGLWMELVTVAQENNLSLSFDDNFDCYSHDCGLSKDKFENYVNHLFEKCKYKLKGYQIDGIYNILLYRKCCAEVTTSGGKTIMCYVYFRYLKDVLGIKHILYITPKTNLTTQSADKFMLYDKDCDVDTDWTYSGIYHGAKKLKFYDQNIVFGNYQSLKNKDDDFFSQFECVILDEAHHGACKSIKTILSKCKNAKYKVGVTGTFPKEGSYDNFVLQSFLGPVVYRYTSYELINNEKFATPVHIVGMKLRYLDKEQLEALYTLRMTKGNDPSEGMKLYNMEKEVVHQSQLRFHYICDLIGKTTKNTLVVYSDIKTEYGMKIYDYIKSYGSKKVYYIDGRTSTQKRDYIKEAMENDTTGNTVIVASVGCFTEGIDIANLWNIILTESTKSDVTMAQLLGRGMRRYPGKDKTILIDIGDDYCFGPDKKQHENYLYRHFKERINIYKKRGFPFCVYDVDLTTKINSLV